MEIATTITSKGQATIPAEVRRRLGVLPGDRIVFIIEDDGTVRVQAPRYPTIESLRGAAGSLPTPLSWQSMRAIASEDRFEKRVDTPDE